MAVIGHRGVGKTTLINRALKPWGVTAPCETTLLSGSVGEPPPSTIWTRLIPVTSYTSHIGSGGKISKPSQCQLVEFDISALSLQSQVNKVFPEGLPEINGVVICYDALRKETLQSIPEALRR